MNANNIDHQHCYCQGHKCCACGQQNQSFCVKCERITAEYFTDGIERYCVPCAMSEGLMVIR